MKLAALVFAFVFLIAAAVQWNDPDPLLWILGYLLAAGLSAFAAAGRVAVLPSAGAAAIFALWFLSLAPSLFAAERAAFTSFQMQASSHEEPREAVGLLLAAGWCGALACWARRRLSSSSSDS
ncbi:MAG: hypothetical protein JRG86_16845 [Deltaproteobacteria bacterium]|jgi:hypothetical protein|nr:hypothetical protein [Deltaproteobacteria bacterium]